MENADTGYHQHSHRRSNYSRSNELHVEKAARENARPQGRKEKAAKKIKALKEAKASSKHKDAFSLFSGLFLYIKV